MKLIGIATLFLYNKEKKVLMQHRGKDEKFYADYWGCFGGHIEEGETPEEALRRELVEELEYKVRDPKLFLTTEIKDDKEDTLVTGYNFIEEYDSTQELIQHEGQGYGWFSIEEALQLKITDSRRNALLKVKELLDIH